MGWRGGGCIISKAVPGSGEICLAYTDARTMSEGPHLYPHSMPAWVARYNGNNYTKGKSEIEGTRLCWH